MSLGCAAGASPSHETQARARTPLPDVEPPIASEPAGDFLPREIASAPFDRLLFDEPGDGALWVRGATYKASFDAGAATVIPDFGDDAPRNYPLELRLLGAWAGGQSLDLAGRGVTRSDDVVRIDRGSLVEEYRTELDRLEQRFVFQSLPTEGELIVRIDALTDLAATDLGKTLRFENELGRIDYGEAFALDAAGRRIALDSVLVDGAIELRVPADFVAGAVFPLVIDPFVTFFTVGGTSRNEFLCDVSYDVTSDRWAVSWADVFSASDYDVYVRLVTGGGTLQGTHTIDFTGVSWTTPAIANNNNANNFLVVAAAVPSSGVAEIRGRLLDPVGFASLSQFQISPLDGAYRNAPDVGGDPFNGVSNYFVVWQRSVSATNVDIEGRLVTSAGTPGAGLVKLEDTSDKHLFPRISNSLGRDIGDGTAGWVVVWQHEYSLHDNDIYGARVGWGGWIDTAMFPIETSNLNETAPVVSTVLDPGALSEHRPYMVVYERDYGDHDLIAAVMRDSTLVTKVNLVGDFPASSWYRDQRTPSVDSDGEQFLVGFDERATPGGPDPDVWTSNYFLANDVLYPCELRKSFAGSPTTEGEVEICSMAGSGGAKKRYFGTWVYLSANNGFDVQGGLWNGCTGGLVESFCAGDGSGASCPCNNHGAPGHGCGNSANASGGLLSANGAASVSSDSLNFSASGLPQNGACLFFVGTQAVASNPFGDGLRCVGGSTARFPLKQVVGGSAAYPGAGDAPISTFAAAGAAGETRFYQAWYRDSASFCTATTFNFTNALKVIWAP